MCVNTDGRNDDDDDDGNNAGATFRGNIGGIMGLIIISALIII